MLDSTTIARGISIVVDGYGFTLEDLVETVERKKIRAAGGREVNNDEPEGEQIDEVVETIGVRHTIDCSKETETEGKKGSDVPRSVCRWVISVKIANGEGWMTWGRGGVGNTPTG